MKKFIAGIIVALIIGGWITLAIVGVISVKTAILIPVGIVIGLLIAFWLFCLWLDSQGEKMTAELKGIHAKTFQDLDVIKDVLKLDEEKIAELEKENAELKKELKEWKDEWQEQVQKATDEGYERTLQTVQLTKAKELLKGWLGDFYSPKAFYQQRAELVEQSEQFLKENSTYERIQKAKYNYIDQRGGECQISSMKSVSLLFVYAGL